MNYIKIDSNYLKRDRRRYLLFLVIGISLIVFTFFLSMCVGNYKTSLSEVIKALFTSSGDERIYTIVVYSRLPRLIASLFVGAALAISGYCYQSIFKNRMASPDILGVSGGAGLGAVIAILLNFSFVLISFFSFIGGIISVLLTISLSKLFKQSQSSVSLLLSGIVVGGLLNSFIGFAKFVSNTSQLASITYWLLGGFNNVKYDQLYIVCPLIFICVLLLLLFKWNISMLQNNDSDAVSHGINPKVVRAMVIVLATIIMLPIYGIKFFWNNMLCNTYDIPQIRLSQASLLWGACLTAIFGYLKSKIRFKFVNVNSMCDTMSEVERKNFIENIEKEQDINDSEDEKISR